MRTTRRPNQLDLWIEEIRDGAILEISPVAVFAVARSAVVMSTAAVCAAAGGGTMTTAAIGASASAHVGLKVAAGCLAATLAAGGTAAATGHLPDPAQRFVAGAAAHVGITLPRPEASASSSAASRITVEGAGFVDVSVSAAGRLHIGEIRARSGIVTDVTSRTDDTIVVEFRSTTGTKALLISTVDGEIVSSVATDGGASFESGTEGSLDTTSKGSVSTATTGSVGASVGSEVEVGLGG